MIAAAAADQSSAAAALTVQPLFSYKCFPYRAREFGDRVLVNIVDFNHFRISIQV